MGTVTIATDREEENYATDRVEENDSQRRLNEVIQRLVEAEKTIDRFQEMEQKIQRLEEEGRRREDEVRVLRERVEEMAWADSKLEEKIVKRREECETATAATEKKLSDELRGIRDGRGAPEANLAPPKNSDNGGGERRRGQGGGGGLGERRKRKTVILTDSNGREATEDSVKRHIPREERAGHEIDICVAYTQEEAFCRVARGEVDVRGATVIIDNITNDVRGTHQRAGTTPAETVIRVDLLRKKLREMGAEAVVVAEVKPMQVVDVRPHNKYLHEYLRAQGGSGYGVETQIRMEYLRPDGFHIRNEFDTVIDKTYACALLGVPVASPTPTENFEPYFVRRRRDAEWPRIVDGAYAQSRGSNEGHARIHGWGW